MKFRILLAVLLLTLVQKSGANTYGSVTFDEKGYNVIQTSDGGYLVAGYQYDTAITFPPKGVELVKLNGMLQTEWTKLYLADSTWAPSTEITESPNHIGYFLLAHYNTFDTIVGDIDGISIIRLSGTGDTLWHNNYYDPDFDNSFGGYLPIYLGVTDNSTIAAGGNKYTGTGGHATAIVEFDTLGYPLTVLDSGGDISAVTKTPGGYILTGNENRATAGGIIVNKGLFYDTTFAYPFYAGNSALSGNTFLTVGSTAYYTQAYSEFFLVQTDTSGDSLSSLHWGHGTLTNIKRVNDNRFYVIGTCDTSGYAQSFVSMMDSDGTFLWTKLIDTTLYARNLVVTDYGFAIVGDSINSFSLDIWFATYDSLGNEITDMITSVTKINNDFSLDVYPNPSSGVFTFKTKLNAAGNYTLHVTDMLGKEVYSEKIYSSVQKMDLKNLSAGNYIIRLEGINEIVGMKKIVIQK